MTQLEKEAYLLVESIINDVPSTSMHVVVNIAFNEGNIGLRRLDGSSLEYYSFKRSRVPELLLSNGVFIKQLFGRFYLGSYSRKLSEKYPDLYGEVALGSKEFNKKLRSLGCMKKNKVSAFMVETKLGTKHLQRFNVGLNRQSAVIVDLEKAKSFLREITDTSLTFSISKGTLTYKGYSAKFDTKLHKSTMRILVDNLNNIVSRKDFYEVRQNEQYDNNENSVEKKKDDINRKMFTKLEKIIENSDIKELVTIVSNNTGYGLFTIQESNISRILD